MSVGAARGFGMLRNVVAGLAPVTSEGSDCYEYTAGTRSEDFALLSRREVARRHDRAPIAGSSWDSATSAPPRGRANVATRCASIQSRPVPAVPATFDICQAIVAPGGRIANVGVHGKPVELHMEKLWNRNISLTTRLVDTITTPMLLKVVRSGKLQPSTLVTHRFAMHDIMKAYDTFGNAAREGALKVVLTNNAL